MYPSRSSVAHIRRLDAMSRVSTGNLSLKNHYDATPSFPTRQLAATYTDFKKLKTLSEGNRDYTITYGVDEHRKRTVYSENGGYKQVRYYMGDYELESNGGRERKIHYLSGGDGLAERCSHVVDHVVAVIGVVFR